MKKLNTLPHGGFKLYSDDLQFMTAINSDYFEMMLKPILEKEDVVVMDGCQWSWFGQTWNVTPGVLLLDGELMHFEGASFQQPAGGDVAYWKKETVVLKTRAFQAGNVEDVHLESRATIEIGGSIPSGTADVRSTPRFWSVVTKSLTYPTWTTLPESSDQFPVFGEPPARFLKDNSGFVHLSGRFSNEDPAGVPIGRLPEGFRPDSDFIFTHTQRVSNSVASFKEVVIQTDGWIRTVEPNGFLGQVVSLNGWPSFRAAL